MGFVLISDESGDNGINLKNQNGMTAYKTVIGMLIFEQEIEKIHEIISKVFLNKYGARIKKWNEFSSKKRRNINFMNDFFCELFSEMQKYNFAFILGIIDKKHYNKSSCVKIDTINSYIHSLKRIVPFIKKYNWETQNCHELTWYIDIAGDREFIDPLREQSKDLSEEKNLKIQGPLFINKPENVKNEDEKIISELIAFVDFIAGAGNKFLLQYYQNKCHNNICDFDFCYKSETDCNNNYKFIWNKIITFSYDRPVIVNDRKIWDLKNIFYYPSRFNDEVLKHIPKDSYFHRLENEVKNDL